MRCIYKRYGEMQFIENGFKEVSCESDCQIFKSKICKCTKYKRFELKELT